MCAGRNELVVKLFSRFEILFFKFYVSILKYLYTLGLHYDQKWRPPIAFSSVCSGGGYLWRLRKNMNVSSHTMLNIKRDLFTARANVTAFDVYVFPPTPPCRCIHFLSCLMLYSIAGNWSLSHLTHFHTISEWKLNPHSLHGRHGCEPLHGQ